MEEGRFDGDGHYHWNKEANIKDNWLDNIDWVKVNFKIQLHLQEKYSKQKFYFLDQEKSKLQRKERR